MWLPARDVPFAARRRRWDVVPRPASNVQTVVRASGLNYRHVAPVLRTQAHHTPRGGRAMTDLTRREFLRAGVAAAAAGAGLMGRGGRALAYVPSEKEVTPGDRPPRDQTIEILHP